MNLPTQEEILDYRSACATIYCSEENKVAEKIIKDLEEKYPNYIFT